MRRITEESINAFYSKKRFKKQNMGVVIEDGCTKLLLHGNVIAIGDDNNQLYIDTCGWNSNTTRNRLNGLEGVHVKTCKGELYLNNSPWDGNLTKIN